MLWSGSMKTPPATSKSGHVKNYFVTEENSVAKGTKKEDPSTNRTRELVQEGLSLRPRDNKLLMYRGTKHEP